MLKLKTILNFYHQETFERMRGQRGMPHILKALAANYFVGTIQQARTNGHQWALLAFKAIKRSVNA